MGTVLLGARALLQAPLAVGAAVLGVLALHELGPALVGLTAELPRWLPPAPAARCCWRWAARTSGGWPTCAAPAAPSPGSADPVARAGQGDT